MAQPKEAPAVQTKRLTIDANFNVSDPNAKISSGDSIQFFSQANQNCSTYFNPDGVFNNQTVPANGSAQAQTTAANQPPVTVDYVIVKPDGTTTQPYSITIDDGPLAMNVDSYGECSIGDAAIPNNGTLFFVYNQDGPTPPATITVNFTTPNGQPEFYDPNNNPVTSQVLSPGSNTILQGRGVIKVDYDFTGTTPPKAARVMAGSGTIKVGH